MHLVQLQPHPRVTDLMGTQEELVQTLNNAVWNNIQSVSISCNNHLVLF